MSHTIQTSEHYQLMIKGDLLNLVKQAMDLERSALKAENYSRKKEKIENELYDLYQEIGWSVVYDMKELPF